MGRKISGPGKFGSMKEMKASLKKSGNASIRNIPKEDSLTVRFLEEPEDWHGYYEHWLSNGPVPCVTDECAGCDSDDPDEQRKTFRYLANAYIVDDQRVSALKMPKSLVESLVAFYTKYGGTIIDRDYELSRTGSGQMDTKYMAIPESPSKMKLSRFADKMLDLDELLNSLVSDDEDEEEERPKKSKNRPWDEDDRPKKSKKQPWDDEDEDEDDDEDDRPKKRAVKSKSRPAAKRTVKRK